MKILICDDHQILREGLIRILQQLDDVDLISQAGDGAQALNLLKQEKYDILLLDISLPDRNGLEILQTVKDRWPETRILILSMHPQEQYAIRALRLGASGYLTKETASDELLLAIRRILAGGRYISQSLAESIAGQFDQDVNRQKHDSLSRREFEIFLKLAAGRSLLEIGNELCISDKTVSTYRSRIMEKMGMARNTELTRYCIENGLL